MKEYKFSDAALDALERNASDEFKQSVEEIKKLQGSWIYKAIEHLKSSEIDESELITGIRTKEQQEALEAQANDLSPHRHTPDPEPQESNHIEIKGFGKAYYESSDNLYVEDGNGDFRSIITGLTEAEEKAEKAREARRGTILERLENTISSRVTGTLKEFEFTLNEPRYSSTPAKPVYKSKIRKARKAKRQAKKRGRK